MVDAVISFAAERLGDVLVTETFFLLGVRSQVKQLRAELIRMQYFLKDADAKQQNGNEGVRHWIAEIRDLAYDAEDVIDTFILKVDSTRRTKTKGIKNFLWRKALMVKNLGHLYRVGNEILAIQARLKAISDSRVTYGIQGFSVVSSSDSNQTSMIQHPLRNRHPHVEDNDVIGFEEHTKTLLTELMKDEEERHVISIIGVGGLGKTTLAKKLYRHDSVKSRFDCCGWSSISQQLNVTDVLGEIMRKCMSLPGNNLQMNEETLMEHLYNYLQDKRYLVVLDDVWKVSHWNTLKPAFPTGKRGSKVLLTTRNKEVALHADPESLHVEPQVLNDDDSWLLLQKNAFPKTMTDDTSCYQDLEKLGRNMVLKCGGLPLGICVLGGLLATKRSDITQWELVHRDVISHINRGDDGGVNGILALSYPDLPSYLKPCFLYLGLFPEDYAISRKKLIQLWIAEGFIPHIEEDLLSTMEDIGKHQYLAELTQRCMIQLGREYIAETGRIGRVCRVHDLMRDLCLSKAKEISFLNICNLQHGTTGDIQTLHPVTTDAFRRYAVHCSNNVEKDERYGICFNKSAIRTLIVIVPNLHCFGGFPLAPINCQDIKLLRVLDLKHVGQNTTDVIDSAAVFRLIHLRYLDLGNFRGSSVSPSIGNLRNLQTFKLSFFSGDLPETTSKLVQLRHLSHSYGSVDRKFRIENLVNLQTVNFLQQGEWIRTGCLEKLTRLRKLKVHNTSRLQTEIILDEVVGRPGSLSLSFDFQYEKKPIRSLSISTQEGFPNSVFDSLSRFHNLHALDLDGKVDGDIVSIRKYLPNLSKLHLSHINFTEDPMVIRVLALNYCRYEGEEMVCSSKGFPQLQYFRIYCFGNVNKWRIDQGGMPLKKLSVEFWDELTALPEGLQFITTLEELKITATPLVKQRLVGEDWYKIQHVPSILTYV